MPGHSAAVIFVGYSPKGDVLVSASADKSVRFWAAADSSAKGKLDLPFVPVRSRSARTVRSWLSAARKQSRCLRSRTTSRPG